MILAFHGATTRTSDIETDVRVSARAGYKALEIWAEKITPYLAIHPLSDLAKLFTDNRVLPTAVNSIEFIAFRGNQFAMVTARLHELGRIAQAIGCPTIVLVASPLPDRSTSWADVRAEYVKDLRELSSIARQYSVRLSFEFLGFGWCSVRTPRAAYEILQEADRDNLGLTIDATHFYTGGGSIDELVRIDPRQIYAFHLNDVEDIPKEAITDAARLLPGLGVIPLGSICERLNRIGYDGSCAIELFRPEYWEWDPEVVAAKARMAAMQVLTPYFKIE